MANTKRLEFPLGISKVAHLQMHFSKWLMPTVSTAHSRMERGEGLRTFYLYVPDGVTDAVATNWGQEEFQQAGNVGSGFLTGASQAALSAVSRLGRGVVGEGNANFIQAKAGHAVVPNQALVLQGPGYFDLSLNFDLTPENQTEAENINEILEICRRYSVPTLSGSVLEYPPIVDINIETAAGAASEDDPVSFKETTKNLLSYRNMVITSFSAAYSGDGGSMLYFHTGHPMSVRMTMQLKSVMPIWNPEAKTDG